MEDAARARERDTRAITRMVEGATVGDNECGREVRMSLNTEEAQGNTAAENDLKYLLLFGSELSDDASIKFPSSCRRKACFKHVPLKL